MGFRKLVVGDRDYRIVWRETTDAAHPLVLEITKVWAVGARADSEIYDEMTHLQQACHPSPHARALAEVIEEMGRLYGGIDAHPLSRPQPPPCRRC